MKPLTLNQLRKAIEVVGTSEKFKNQPTGTNLELLRAVTYMTKAYMGLSEPRDPRQVLTEVGYQW